MKDRAISFFGAILLFACCAALANAQEQSTEIIPVEVFHVGQLPVALSTVELVGSSKGYQLRCSMTNYSDEKLLGFRYSIVAIDSSNTKSPILSRSEGWELKAYATKRKIFPSLLPANFKNQVRIVLMLQEIVGTESIWEVIKAKEALDAYASGDFTTVPTVLRAPNHVDAAPPALPIRYRF
jgi:hypothetical protein